MDMNMNQTPVSQVYESSAALEHQWGSGGAPGSFVLGVGVGGITLLFAQHTFIPSATPAWLALDTAAVAGLPALVVLVTAIRDWRGDGAGMARRVRHALALALVVGLVPLASWLLRTTQYASTYWFVVPGWVAGLAATFASAAPERRAASRARGRLWMREALFAFVGYATIPTISLISSILTVTNEPGQNTGRGYVLSTSALMWIAIAVFVVALFFGLLGAMLVGPLGAWLRGGGER